MTDQRAEFVALAQRPGSRKPSSWSHRPVWLIRRDDSVKGLGSPVAGLIHQESQQAGLLGVKRGRSSSPGYSKL